MKERILEFRKSKEEMEKRLGEEASNYSILKEEIEMYRATEKEIAELNKKVTVLSDTLKEKTRRVSELESLCHSQESELKAMKLENETLLEKALEVSSQKVSMLELSKTMGELRKQLEEKEVFQRQIMGERDQLLSRVREFEVQKHTLDKPVSVAAVEPKVTADVSDVHKLLQSLEQKEEEVMRTREYTEDLLMNVMMKAPFLLEK